MSLSEEQLIEKAKTGDAAAYRELFNQYQSKIYNFSCSLTGNNDAAKNTAEQTFMKVYEALPGLKEINFSVYLHQTARNIALNELKTGEDLASETPAVQKEETADARKIAAGLPEQMRTALTLRELQEMSYDEIAQVLEIPKNSVGALLMSARVKFQEALRISPITAKELSKECEEMLPRLSAYLDNELSPKEVEEVKSHLEGCPLCRLALEEQTEASKSYRGIAPLAPPAALAADFFAALDEAGAAELEKTPDSSSDMTIEMPKLDLEEEGIPVDESSTGGPWYRNLKTWAIIGAGAGAIALGLLVGAYTLNTESRTAKPATDKAVIDTYRLDGGIQSTDVPILDALEATKALEKSLETKEASETTSAASSTGDTSETTSTDPASTGSAAGDPTTSASPDTTAPPAPSGLSPASGSVEENENVTFAWGAVSDPSGVTYSIEIERMLKDGSWPSLIAQTGLTDPSFVHNLGDTQERWRIWAVDGAGNAGLKTDWYLIQRATAP